jgi:hypothetical protein
VVTETVFGSILIFMALAVGVGGPFLALHFQTREAHERRLVEAVVDHATTVDKYRQVTQLEPEDVGSPIAPEHEVDAVRQTSLADH